jgi:hypothetical protein
LNLRPLGYEQCDTRLCHLGLSLVTVLISPNLRLEALTSRPRLPSQAVPECPVYKSVYRTGALPVAFDVASVRARHIPACRSSPSPSAHLPWGLACLALPGSMVTG